MQSAKDKLIAVGRTVSYSLEDGRVAWELLASAAEEWRHRGDYFAAAYAMQGAIHATGGSSERLEQVLQLVITDCRSCIEAEALDSLRALAALSLWAGMLKFYEQKKEIRRACEALYQELMERLLVVFAEWPQRVGFLVRGIDLAGSLEGNWEAIVPPEATTGGGESIDEAGRIKFWIPPAFLLCRMMGDYAALHELVLAFPDEFDAAAMRGWKFAILASYASTGQAELYTQAADAFDQDRPSPGTRPHRRWDVAIWSSYYRARAALAKIPASQDEAKTLINVAVQALEGCTRGVVKEEVFRFAIIVRALAALVGAEDPHALDSALAELYDAQRIFGPGEFDIAAQRFLSDARNTLAEFERDPARAMASGLVPELLEALARLPQIGLAIADSVKLAVHQHTLSVIRGIDRTWIHRELEAIDNERRFQRIFVRLLQAVLPSYAQVRCGPLEYGKDVVVVAERAGRQCLWMYQLKIGDINMAAWRDVKPQLEEMFLVQLETINVNTQIDEHIGVLVCNGHAQPNVDPVMKAWFRQQHEILGHRYEFMQLDTLVNWIDGERLYNTFRAALRETSSFGT